MPYKNPKHHRDYYRDYMRRRRAGEAAGKAKAEAGYTAVPGLEARVRELEAELATLRAENARLREPTKRAAGKQLANTGRDSGQLEARIRDLEAQLARALKTRGGIFTAEEYRKIRAAVQPRPHDGPQLQKVSEEATKLVTHNETLLSSKKEVQQPSKPKTDFSEVLPIVTRYTEGQTKVNIEKVLAAIFAEIPELRGSLGVLGAQYVQRCLMRLGFMLRGQKTWERPRPQ
jgi:hypothetical protein